VGVVYLARGRVLSDRRFSITDAPRDGSAYSRKDGAWVTSGSSHTHSIADITDFTDNSTNWDTAYGWGDHSVQNYFDLDANVSYANVLTVSKENAVGIHFYATGGPFGIRWDNE
jgi:hypothetical protein